MKTIILKILLASVVILGVVYYLSAVLRKGHSFGLQNTSVVTEVFISRKEIPACRLIDLDGNEVTINDQYLTGRNLFIFFSPRDCSTCLREAKYWQMFYEKNIPNVRILGVVQSTHLNYLQRFRTSYYLAFPIFIDKNATLFNELAISRTPLKILTDKNGKILKVNQTVFKNYNELHDFFDF